MEPNPFYQSVDSVFESFGNGPCEQTMTLLTRYNNLDKNSLQAEQFVQAIIAKLVMLHQQNNLK
tara:strand:+ start:942 stop:1133 length:192 start_codon:yes stop_codon:yes gene_type:complete